MTVAPIICDYLKHHVWYLWLYILFSFFIHIFSFLRFHFHARPDWNQNITKVSKSVFQLKISKYRLYRRRFLRGFRHFSAFFAIYPNILEKMRQNVKKCKNPSHQISEIFRKSAKNGHILILWLYFILWYFAGFLHFHFEICENLQPGKNTS